MYRSQASAFTGTPSASAHHTYPGAAPAAALTGAVPSGHLRTLARLLFVRPAVTAVVTSSLAALAVGWWGLDRGSMWREESVTFQAAQRSLPELAQLIGSADAVHGVYYVLMHFVLQLHPGEVMLRLPSVLAVALTAGLVAAIGARLVRARVGLWAGLLYAVTPATGYYATDGSPYALVCAGAAAATWLFLRAVEHGRPRDWCRYGAVVGCTAYLHPLAALLLAAHAVTLLVSWRRISADLWRGWTVAGAAALTALLPLIGLLYGGTGGAGSGEAVSTEAGVGGAEGLFRSFAGPAPLVITAVLLLGCIALNAPLPRTGRISLNTLALPLALVPPALLLATAQTVRPGSVLFALAGVPLLTAAGGERCAAVVRRLLPPGRAPHRAAAALAGAAAVAAACLWQLPQHRAQATAEGRPDDMAAVARLAARELVPGDPVLFLPAEVRRHALTYPAGFAGTKDLALQTPPSASGAPYGKETDAIELRRRLAKVDRVWLLAERGATDAAWNPSSATEAAKLSVINEQFVLRGEFPERSGVLRMYVRRAPERPIDWPAGKPVPVVDPVLEAYDKSRGRGEASGAGSGESGVGSVGAPGVGSGESGVGSVGAPGVGSGEPEVGSAGAPGVGSAGAPGEVELPPLQGH
ncbi:glycosyltransferase family 39 protein [Streptomyces sp. TRM66268-LWL]|uniref:Glycosyltransferase family 39 protein n=1 Tax=Streptomyces polyasparticus TaxID=2767826 RepID=A0ABR7SRM7_9ACTN|nr:glycosyltransferase family 39 protein [Streptomyces polyasparticus]MBC9718160.1 glycosyltransferase family 39 protein [Streptomyces polyasparticus]